MTVHGERTLDSIITAYSDHQRRTRRLADLPRHIDEEQHTRFLKSLDVSTPRLRRDRAIILCLSALGLRAGEVADLCIEDIDWRAGTLLLPSRKTRPRA